MARFAGRATLVVNGLPIVHCASIDDRTQTNRELALGMSPTGKPVGFSDGTKVFELTVEVYIPSTGDIAWEDITEGTIVISSTEGNVAPQKIYLGCFVVSVSDRYSERGTAKRRLEMRALDRIGG